MKHILTFFLVACLSTYAIAQDKEAEFISGEKDIWGTVSDKGVSIDYQATVKYRITLFGGIKINANITNFRFYRLKYKGKDISRAVEEKLGFSDRNGNYYPKRGTFDFMTDFVFSGFSYIDNHNRVLAGLRVADQRFLAIGWGTLDEYIYLEDEDVKRIYEKYKITKNNLKDFYNLDVTLEFSKITFFSLPMIDQIKEEMDKEIDAEEELNRKLKALKKLYPDEDLSLSQLQYKVSLLNEIIATGYTACSGYYSCHRDLSDAKEEIKKRKEKGEEEDEDKEENEAVAENEENTEEQQRLAQEQKRKQAEAKRKATEAKKKAEQQRQAEAERKRKEEEKRKAEEEKKLTYNGKTYKTVQIGNQIWMAENLNDDGHTRGKSFCYDDDANNCTTYGRLYDWEAAKDIADKIPGWHLPTADEWLVLIDYLGGIHVAGGKLKKGGSSDFNALLAGSFSRGSSFYGLGEQGWFWSASLEGSRSPEARLWYSFISHSNDRLFVSSYTTSSSYSRRSVRLLKD